MVPCEEHNYHREVITSEIVRIWASKFVVHIIRIIHIVKSFFPGPNCAKRAKGSSHHA